jgi:hypothetical protein
MAREVTYTRDAEGNVTGTVTSGLPEAGTAEDAYDETGG